MIGIRFRLIQLGGNAESNWTAKYAKIAKGAKESKTRSWTIRINHRAPFSSLAPFAILALLAVNFPVHTPDLRSSQLG